jgi:hypothetical protein
MADTRRPVPYELLTAIGRGRLDAEPLHNGCWCGSMWWESRGIEGGGEAMQAIEHILRSYLDGRPLVEVASEHPHARGLVERAYEWLGPVGQLTEVQRLLSERRGAK